MSLSLFRTTPLPAATAPQTCSRPNYFFGAPASDQPSQKVAVADKLAVSCGIDTDTNKTLLPAGAQPGEVIFENQALKWGVTALGTSGDILASGGGGSSPPYWDSLSCQGGNLVVTNLEIEGDLTLNALLPNGVLLGGAAALVTTNTGFLWTDATQNLQLGTRGVSVGVSAGIGTTSVAIGNVAGQSVQGISCVAIGNEAGRLTQSTLSVAVGYQTGTFSQGTPSVAIGNDAGTLSQGTGCVAIGSFAAFTRQQNQSVAIGTSAGQTFQASASVAIGTLAGSQSQIGGGIAIGLQAGQTAQQANPVAIGTLAGAQTQAASCVAIGNAAGQTSQQANAVAIGNNAGAFSQATQNVAIGDGAGQTLHGSSVMSIGWLAGNNGQVGPVSIGSQAGQTSQQASSVALGNLAGNFSQATQAVALGGQAGQTLQRGNAVAIGNLAGNVSQGASATALGYQAGFTGQAVNTVAIGNQAGQTSQGTSAIAIGNLAGQNAQTNNSICLNASGAVLNPTTGGFYVNPIRSIAAGAGTTVLSWVAASTEIINNTTKTFVIPDPIAPDSHLLVHSCVEGPQVGVYYRGDAKIRKGDLKTQVVLPSYATSFVSQWVIQVSPQNNPTELACSEVTNGIFEVLAQTEPLTDLTFSWIVYGTRSPLQTEPQKQGNKVEGQGPYQWFQENEK